MVTVTLDVGNTDTVIGVFRGKTLVFHKRIQTSFILRHLKRGGLLSRHGSPLGLRFTAARENLLFSNGTENVIISSVVPKLDSYLRQKFKNATFVSHKLKLPIKLHVDRPKEVGADRIVNNSAAYVKYGGPVLVIDFGTATTMDYIDAHGAYQGGMIIPGLKISADALFQKASKLSPVKLKAPKKLLGKNTVHQMQSGIVLGYAAMIEALIGKIKKRERRSIKVVMTGGIANILSPVISIPHIFEPFLTLEGLNCLSHLN